MLRIRASNLQTLPQVPLTSVTSSLDQVNRVGEHEFQSIRQAHDTSTHLDQINPTNQFPDSLKEQKARTQVFFKQLEQRSLKNELFHFGTSKRKAALNFLKEWALAAETQQQQIARGLCASRLVDLDVKRVHGKLLAKGNLRITDNKISELPENLHVAGYLEITNSTLTHLPDNLSTDSSLSVKKSAVCHFGNNLKVGLHLDLSNTPRNFQFGKSVEVGGSMKLCHTTTAELPARLQVRQDLDIAHTPVSNWPQHLEVGRHIYAYTCPNLKKIPDTFLKLGPSRPGESRIIDMAGSGLSETEIDRLPITDDAGVRFITSHDIKYYRTFKTLDDALSSWNCTPDNKHLNLKNLKLTAEQQKLLNHFLSKLHYTKDAQHSHYKSYLKSRIFQFIRHLSQNDNAFQKSVFERIDQGLESCSDRTTLIMNDIEKLTRIRQARQSAQQEEALRTLGIGFMALEEVHKFAAQKCIDNPDIDEIQVYLYFELYLKNALNLPVHSMQMEFPAHSRVSPIELIAAKTHVAALLQNEKAVNEYLSKWEPMQQFKREKATQDLKWSSLEIYQGNVDKNACCLISSEPLKNIKPVILNDNLYDLAALLQHWIEKGNDPTNRQSFKLTDLTRVKIQ